MGTYTIADKDAVTNLLNSRGKFQFQNGNRESTFVKGLRECRVLAGRDMNTGELISPKSNNSIAWLSVFGYYALLDALGGSFLPKCNPQEEGNAIKKAVKNFGYHLISNDERKLNALVALRNSFIHDFNLVNTPKNPVNEKFRFEVHFRSSKLRDGSSLNIVENASAEWDGKLEKRISGIPTL